MREANWLDRNDALPELARALASRAEMGIGVDTEFLRERTFFPRLCVLQLAAGEDIWLIDALRAGSLAALVEALTGPGRKIIHAARQDLEAFYLSTRRVIAPLFDTQIAAACVGLKPQIGYAELVNTLLSIALPKGQTRTDWSKRPLTPAQLEYAADDVRYLNQIADRLTRRLTELGREHWAHEDCSALENADLYDPDPAAAGSRLRGLAQMEPHARGRAKRIAVWRERLARDRDLPRSWIIPDPAIFAIAHANPTTRSALDALQALPATFNDGFAKSLLGLLQETAGSPPEDLDPVEETRPTAEQKNLLDRLAKAVDSRAAELGVHAELLAPRGELKALAMRKRGARGADSSRVLTGWRRAEIGAQLFEMLPAPL